MSKPSLKYFACGQTSHNLALIYKGIPREQRVFPAGAFLFGHPDGRKVLYDTGYAPSMVGTGWFGRLYSKLLPPVIEPHETIDRQLIEDGIHPGSIGHVVVSHLHPDHIGGIRYFPNSTFVVSEQVIETLDNHQLRALSPVL